MRSRPGYRSWFGSHVLGAIALCTSLLSYADAARAQADAGVQHAARVPTPPPPPAAPAPEEPAPPSGAEQAPGLKKLDPAQLSESVRTRLQQHTLGRHASNLPAPEIKPRHEAPSE